MNSALGQAKSYLYVTASINVLRSIVSFPSITALPSPRFKQPQQPVRPYPTSSCHSPDTHTRPVTMYL